MNNTWPKLEYSEWKSTCETLHLFLQIVGKFRFCKSPTTNHSWSCAFYVTSRGLTTSAIPFGEFNLTVDFDFIEHKVVVQDSLGRTSQIPLLNETVSSFYTQFTDTLAIFEITPTFKPMPNEMKDAIPFAQDLTHRTYSRIEAFRFFQALVRVNNVFQEFRSNFVGKSSPVHLFWGSFDLAVTRFSGKNAPEHPGGVPHLSDDVVREAYSHEVMSCGFWPGNEQYPHAAFYAYAYPEPAKFSKAKITPPEAFYHEQMHEFILPYETVRSAIDPAGTLLSFLDSTYRAAANLGSWDRESLEITPHLLKLKEINRSSFGDEAIRQ
jgi:hypothetical protein